MCLGAKEKLRCKTEAKSMDQDSPSAEKPVLPVQLPVHRYYRSNYRPTTAEPSVIDRSKAGARPELP